jgi:hypothetical protein
MMDERKKAHLFTEQVAFAMEWLKKCGMDSAPLLDVMTGKVASIGCLSHTLLARELDYQAARLSRERGRTSKSKSGAAAEEVRQSMGLVRGEGWLPSSVVDFLISLMIDICARADVAPPVALAQLVRVHLGANTFAAQQVKAPGALDKAAQYRLAYPDASQDEIARHAGVTRPRVSQWIKTGHLDRAVERIGRVAGAAELIRSTTPRAQ